MGVAELNDDVDVDAADMVESHRNAGCSYGDVHGHQSQTHLVSLF